jgi:hypothetical protein
MRSKASEICEDIVSATDIDTALQFAPDQSPTWMDPDIVLCLPYIGDSDFPTFRDVVQKILTTSLSCLYFDNEGKARYKSFFDGIYDDVSDIENQSGINPDDSINQSNSKNFSIKFDLYDQYSQVYFKPINAPQSGSASADESESWYLYGGYAESKLYKSNKIYEVETLLDVTKPPVYGDFFNEYRRLITGRNATYSVDVHSRHFKLYVGDDIKLSRKAIIGNETEKYVRVVSISKASNESRLKLLDLKRFPL